MELKPNIFNLQTIPSLAFNQTRMELKLPLRRPGEWRWLAFNQTRMELKRTPSNSNRSLTYTFNQTRMELKQFERVRQRIYS